jgi:hypothetical protein
MAIERTDAPKTEWTPTSVALMGVSLVLVLAAFALGWFAYVNWSFKSNLEEGLREYAQGRNGTARTALRAALAFRPMDVPSRELLAKIDCDEGNLTEAARHYKVLRAQGFKGAQVNAGLGAVALKEAIKLEDPKQVETKVREAQAEYKAASGLVPEADLGIGHGELILAWKLNEPARLASARAVFEKIRAALEGKPEYRAAITRDGLVDYYAGLGKILGSAEAYDPAASAAYRACAQLVRRWHAPMASLLSVECKRWEALAANRDQMEAFRAEITALKNETGNLIRSQREAKDAVKEAWLQYSLATAGAWGRAGGLQEVQANVRDILSTRDYDGRLEPFIQECRIRTDAALKEDPNGSIQDRLVGEAANRYGDLVQKLAGDEARKELRATALNNLAWMQGWRGGYGNSSSMHTQALDRLAEALKIQPDDYLLNRNSCVLLKRLNRPSAAWQALAAKAKAAAGTDWGGDWEKVEKYLGSN